MIIDKKKFVKNTPNKNLRTFIIYIVSLILRIIYLLQKFHIALWFIIKITILNKYINYANIFLKN